MTDPHSQQSNPRPGNYTWNPPQQQFAGGHAPGNTFGTPGGAAPRVSQPTIVTAQKPSRVAILVASTALAAVVGAGAGVGGYAWLGAQAAGTQAAPAISAVPVAQPSTLDGSITAAAGKISPSVVTITVRSGQSGGIGSGVVLDSEGHILTNEHVVSEANTGTSNTGTGGNGTAEITVTFEDGSTASATVVGMSPKNDLAVIKVSGVAAGELKPATFSESSSVVVGQSVVAVGAPLGLSETVTSGIVSATARAVRSGTTGDAVYQAVQTDAAINPGNSGGPLVDLNGLVIGINAAGASLSSGSEQSGNIGLGFAIPSDVAVRVANELIADGTASDATLGVNLQAGDSTEDTTSAGVVLAEVANGGAAGTAGLRAGDVITAVDDVNTTTTDALIAAIRFHAPGTIVTIRYLRDDQPAEVQVTLGSS